MIDLVKRFLGKGEEDRGSAAEGQGGHDIRVATCALLLEISNVDGALSQEERDRLVSILEKEHGLTHEEIEGLIHEAGPGA